LAIAVLVLQGTWRETASQALLAYGASILSFLGGIRWGLAVAQPGRARLWPELSLSVLPSLLAWAALLVPRSWGFWLLAITLAAQLLLDLRATRQGVAPSWFPKLRWPLTLGAATAMVAGALA
jgi:hypothetical protein